MKQLIALLMALLMLFSLTACGGGEKPPTEPGPTDVVYVSPTPAAEAQPLMPKEEFEALSAEEIVEKLTRGADSTDEDLLQLHRYAVYGELNDSAAVLLPAHLMGAVERLDTEYGVKITSGDVLVDAFSAAEEPILRIYLAQIVYDVLDRTSPEALSQIAELIRNDPDETVRAGVLLASQLLAKASDDIYSAILDAANDKSVLVRRNLPAALQFSAGNEDAQATLKALLSDPDAVVQARAGFQLAKKGDSSCLPQITALLQDPKIPEDDRGLVHQQVALSLVTLSGIERHGQEQYIEEAYDACLSYLRQVDAENMAFNTIADAFGKLPDDYAANAPWYDPNEVIEAITYAKDSAERSTIRNFAEQDLAKLTQP